jgi:dihydrofolate reductase
MPSLRSVHYYIATSVDGFIARADGSFDCFPMEGDHVAAYQADLAGFDTVLMGRKTYDVGLSFGVTNPYPTMKALVFSRTLEASPDPNVELVRGDPAERVRALKAAPGGAIYLCGGGELAGQLWRAGLVDELTVKVNPLVLGAGLPMLAGLAETPLQLASQRTFESGVVFLRYRVVRRGAAG